MKKLLTEKELNGLQAKEYCRKSNESEDKQTHSLEDQHFANRKSIERVGLIPFGQYFEEAKSAKRRGRPFFNQMIEEIEKGKYSVIVCFNLNRLSRNAVDAGFLIELLDQGKLKAIVTSGKTYFNTGEDKLLMTIELGLSKKTSDDLWPVVERGMVSKVHRQWWPSKPKPGYLNLKTSEMDEPIQVIDPIRFPLLREAVDEILLGINPAEALRKLNKKGYRTRKTRNLGGQKMSTTNFYKFLKDPYYYGRLFWNGEESTLHPNLQRLMTIEEYWKIQSILGKKGVERPKEKFDIPYRGLLKCLCCNKTIVVYSKDKKQKDGSNVLKILK
jgi:DNA invertase Pin-like site-specific DNA recombinase